MKAALQRTPLQRRLGVQSVKCLTRGFSSGDDLTGCGMEPLIGFSFSGESA